MSDDEGPSSPVNSSAARADFDPQFYLFLYRDVEAAGEDPWVHYLRHGVRELRIASAAQLRRMSNEVLRSGRFAAQARRNASRPSALPGLNALEFHLALNWRNGAELLPGFNDLTYYNLYADVMAGGTPPLLHFLGIGAAEGRLAPSIEGSLPAVRASLDVAHYGSQRAELDPRSDLALDYLTLGRWRGLEPTVDFNPAYYSERYPDLADVPDAFLHFQQHGSKEGRVGRPNFSPWFEPGELPFDHTKPTLLVATHEASRTGAPLVALAVGEFFGQTHNIIYHSGRGGPIADALKRSSILVVTGPVHGPDAWMLLRDLNEIYPLTAAILNSVETFELAEGALYTGLPSIGLIHEFAEYSAGRVGRMTAAVDRAIFPAQLLLTSAEREVRRDYGSAANNTLVRPQGILPALPKGGTDKDLTREEILAAVRAAPGVKPKIVLGAGFVHIRKGVDIFVQAAAQVRDHFGDDYRFIWVGHGYNPEVDFGYPLWVRETLDRLELRDTMFFLEPQASLDTLFDLADVFFLPSRLDPFPNVALDAFEAGKPVVCFDGATGVAEFLSDGRAVGAAVRYGDVGAAAEAIADLFRQGDIASANAELGRTIFGFDEYGAFLKEQLEEARLLRARQSKAFDRLDQAGVFNASFHEGRPVVGEAGRRALQRYVSRGFKGLTRLNPRPGFSDNLYKSQHGLDLDGEFVALDQAILDGSPIPPSTHVCTIYDGRSNGASPGDRIALHLHLFYPDLARDFLNRLEKLDRRMDLFITTHGAKKVHQLEYEFADYALGTVSVVDCPNKGRDIGPFMTALRSPLAGGGYDLIGHLHGKKSLAVEDRVPGLGARWREYALDALLGTASDFHTLLGRFGLNPKLGLVFAEDRNAVGWAGNRSIAEALAARLPSAVNLPAAPFYPLGNMFWARPAALSLLWNLNLGWDDYPPEPLPYDGTVLHTVERMLPSLVEAAGYDWETVYKPGASW